VALLLALIPKDWSASDQLALLTNAAKSLVLNVLLTIPALAALVMSISLFLFTVLLLLASTKNVAAALAITAAKTSMATALVALNFNCLWIVALVRPVTLIFVVSAHVPTSSALMAALLIPISTMPYVQTLRDAHKMSAVSVITIKYCFEAID